VPDLWLLLFACAVVTYLWRGLGVLLSGRLAVDSDAFDWITCVAYAMVAGLIVRIIVMPSGLLASSLLSHRLLACAIALIAFYACRRNLFVGVGAGALALAAFNMLRLPGD
jgi:branched-subunit amino acid transport protein